VKRDLRLDIRTALLSRLDSHHWIRGLHMTDAPVTQITGGASGIGAATARRLLDQAHRVTITGRDHHRLGRFAEELGEPAGLLTLAGDAADYTAVQAAVESTVHKFGRLDTVVANAGFATHGTLADGDPDRGARWS
jgi:NADP-dependent 3-hydroxy acid dehydrogenase YdfG